MCRLRLVLLFYCDCLLLLVFIFTWHPLKQKIPDEQVPKGLLSRNCERSFQFIPKRKLLWMGVRWRVLEKSSLDCSGDDDGWNFFWTTVKMEYLYIFRYCWWHCKHFLFITEILCIMWPVMFFISYFENPKDFNLRKVVFPTDWIFLFAHSFANGDFFLFCSTLCLLCWSPWIDFYTKHQLEEHQ